MPNLIDIGSAGRQPRKPTNRDVSTALTTMQSTTQPQTNLTSGTKTATDISNLLLAGSGGHGSGAPPSTGGSPQYQAPPGGQAPVAYPIPPDDQATLAGGQAPPGDIPGIDPGTQLRDLTEAEIEAVMGYIEAKYGLSRSQLLSQQDQLGLMAQSLMTRAEQLRTQGVRGAQNQASERGILRSGIHARNVANVNTDIARQVGDATQQFQSTGGGIDTALARLQDQELSEKAAAEASIRSGLLQFEQGQTLASLLASLPLQPVQPPPPVMPAPPVLTQPLIPGAPGPWDVYGQTAGQTSGQTQQSGDQSYQDALEEYLRRLQGGGTVGAFAT